MSRRFVISIAALWFAIGLLPVMTVPVAGQTAAARTSAAKAAPAKGWTVPRTADGQPDLQGIWDYRTATPLERPKEFAGREFLSDNEAVEFERRAAARADGRPPDDARVAPSVHAVWWLDYGKNVVGTRRTSLVIDPPDGRIPPLTPEAQKRAADRRAATLSRGSADSWEDRSLWERCITRGLPEGMLPAGYNNNIQIVQTRDHVLLFSEMIHDARIVPLDGRPRLPKSLRQWMGDSRGRWEGDMLVVETTNFSDKASFRGAGANLHLVERFSRSDANTIEYTVTVSDPTTWTKPWTLTFPMVKNQGRIYEYACHEGNYGLLNILTAARADNRAAAATRK